SPPPRAPTSPLFPYTTLFRSLRGRLARGFHDPLDDLGVGELDDDAVPHAPRHAEGPRAVARYLHRDLGQLVADPFELELLLVPRSEERRVGKECRCWWPPEQR